jgi:hypothetical protein
VEEGGKAAQMLKKRLNENERFGLTHEEIKLAEQWLRRHKTAGALRDAEAMKLFELFMIGTSFTDMHLQYPQYPMGQIILTAALRCWGMDRDRMMSSLKERVRAKVVKSVVESVDFLTSLISVATVEHVDTMRKYIEDPGHNPPPDMRVKSLKEYKEILESLQKLVDGASGNPKQKASALYGALDTTKKMQDQLPKKDDGTVLLAEAVDVDDPE